MSDARVLDGISVVELAADPAGEMVGKLLAEMGADVLKVESPEGSPTRTIGPFAHGRVDADHSLTFWYYNTNKRSVVVDYRTDEGSQQLVRLIADADVFISTLAPPELRARGSTSSGCAPPPRNSSSFRSHHSASTARGPTGSAATSSASPSAAR